MDMPFNCFVVSKIQGQPMRADGLRIWWRDKSDYKQARLDGQVIANIHETYPYPNQAITAAPANEIATPNVSNEGMMRLTRSATITHRIALHEYILWIWLER